MEVKLVSRYEDLLEYVPAWDDLAAAALEPNPFYESWLLLPAIRHLRAQEDITVALIYQDASPRFAGRPLLCGLFPLQRIRFYMGLPISGWSFWKHPHCGFTLPLIHKEYAPEVLATLFQWLVSKGPKGRLLELKFVPGDGTFNQVLADLLHSMGITPLLLAWYRRAMFRPMATADVYLAAALSGKHRKSLRRRAELLSEMGPVEYIVARPETDIECWIESFLLIESSGWKGREGSAMACRESDRNFFADAVRYAFRNDRLLMTALTVGGKIIAQNCYFRAGRGSFHFKPAFDEQYARFSPGFHMECELIRYLHSRRDIEWMDSCTHADNELFNRLFLDRRVIQSLVVPLGGTIGDIFVSGIPLIRSLKSMIRSKLPFSTGKKEVPDDEGAGIHTSESKNAPALGQANGTVKAFDGANDVGNRRDDRSSTQVLE
jgi:hypothetical protein